MHDIAYMISTEVKSEQFMSHALVLVSSLYSFIHEMSLMRKSGVSQGQNNRNVHRLDILWPLVQILQSKSTMHAQ